MIHSQNTVIKSVIAPVSVGTTAVTGLIDTLGAEYCKITFHVATQAASQPPTTMSVGHGEATNSFTALTDSSFAIPTPNTSSAMIVPFFVNCSTKKRYLQVSLANTAATISAVTAELSRNKETPNSDTEMGAADSAYF